MKKILLSGLVVLLLHGCSNSGGKNVSIETDSSLIKTIINDQAKSILPPLEPGEIHITNDAFGPTIDLKGEVLNIKENIKPQQLFVKDKYLITNNQRSDSIFMIFELPGMKCVASFGVKGNGPDEFNFPQIVETTEDSVLFYIYEMTNEKIYKVSAARILPEYYLTLSKANRSFGDKQIFFTGIRTAFYASSTAKGKMIYTYNTDSIPQERVLCNLSIKGKKGSWTTWIGDFGVNRNEGRAAYAYKYFKRLKIIDLGTKKEREIIFDSKELATGQSDIATLEPTNITHFWGMSANQEYFWMLYSGRTPVDVMNDNRNKRKYIYVEKYDWNGNPVKRYKLDDWGYFCVDKKNEMLYLASTASVWALVRYSMADTMKR
jgi:hypothetical protein